MNGSSKPHLHLAAVGQRKPADAPEPLAYLEIGGVAKSFRNVKVLDDLDISIRRGEIVSLLGPSGCGKTTLLRAIAGLIDIDKGRIRVGGVDITDLPTHRREVGVVFQNYALFPHLDVRGNIGVGLRAKGLGKAAIAARVEEMLKLTRLEALANRSVGALSGGQQQRVAVARALAVSPRLLLLDEPFSALDRKLRETMQVELRGLLSTHGITAIFVTHDQEEAMVVSDRIAVMREGRIEQFADVASLYNAPATRFVYEFVGLSTVIAGTVRTQIDGICDVHTRLGPIRVPGSFMRGASVVVCLRPEAISLRQSKMHGAPIKISCPVRHVSFFGSRGLVYGDVPEPERFVVELDAQDLAAIRPGESVDFFCDPSAARLFPAETASV